MRRWVLAVAAIVAALAACGEEPPDRPATQGAEKSGGTDPEASPFSVGWVPEGFSASLAGKGEAQQDWGVDETGTDEPFTVLAPKDEEPTAENVLIVTATGYQGNQGGLAQESADYGNEDIDSFDIDGRPAYFAPAGVDPGGVRRYTEVVAALGEDLAVRTTAPNASREFLTDVIRRTQPADEHHRAPAVDPPDGWRVLGSAGADFVLAVEASPPRVGRDEVPGPPQAYSALWRRGDDTLLVLTLPGDAVDLDAVVGYPRFYRLPATATSDIALSTERGVLLEGVGPSRALITSTGWGDAVVVLSQGKSLLAKKDLARVAASVEDATAAQWDEFVLQASGGPGLHPEPGWLEVARGTEGGVEWLLQARPPGSAGDNVPADETGYVADACLKLSTRRRACAEAQTTGGGNSDVIYVSFPRPGVEAGAPELPGFIIFTTTMQAHSARIESSGEVATAPLVSLPGQPARWATVVFMERPGLPSCNEHPAPFDLVRIDLLDTAGHVVGCVGFG
jgi:hypothetical protein